jgi:hypothetical protein
LEELAYFFRASSCYFSFLHALDRALYDTRGGIFGSILREPVRFLLGSGA